MYRENKKKKWGREEPTIKNTLPSNTLLQIWWRNQKLFREAKVKRIQHHQTSFTTNAKGNSLSRKHEKRKRPTENKLKTIKKMVIGSYISIITLTVNGLNAPTKRHRLAGWIKKIKPISMLSTRGPPQTYGHFQTESKGLGEGISCKWKS